MGFKDAEWAYKLKLPPTDKAVLVAICHRTDDKSHETLVGQHTVALMTGLSDRTVQRSWTALTAPVGPLVRARRRHKDTHFRTTDRVTVDVAWAPAHPTEGLLTESQETESHLTDSPTSPDTVSGQVEVPSTDHSEGHSGEGRTKRGTRIPDDFAITPEMVSWAREHAPLVDGHTSTDMFVDHWTAATGRNASKLDWTAAWRNWLRRDQQNAARNPRKLTPTERARQTLAITAYSTAEEISA